MYTTRQDTKNQSPEKQVVKDLHHATAHGKTEKNITEKNPERPVIKCVVWDLDNTLWQGVLLEDEAVRLRPGIVEIIQALDKRGILQSIASKNEPTRALARLASENLQQYFLYPQISWNSKVSSIEAIATSLNIGLDAIAFIDDQPFELEEVSFSLPQVLGINAAEIEGLLSLPEMQPRFVTADAAQRRQLYLNDIERNQAETDFVGPQADFLATLNMRMTIAPAQKEDLKRAEELTIRTHQLNATGYTYSFDELDRFRQSSQHQLLVASLDDKFGSYGTIGLALIDTQPQKWTLKLLLMSCRVMSRGVGTVLLNHIMQLAKDQQVALLAEFLPTDRNRMMYVTYKFAGFKELDTTGHLSLLASDLSNIQPFPDYMSVNVTP